MVYEGQGTLQREIFGSPTWGTSSAPTSSVPGRPGGGAGARVDTAVVLAAGVGAAAPRRAPGHGRSAAARGRRKQPAPPPPGAWRQPGCADAAVVTGLRRTTCCGSATKSAIGLPNRRRGFDAEPGMRDNPPMTREDCILFSGAAGGAEAEFGAAAERHGIEEVNFTFEGHPDARRRGIRVLTHAELEHGDVSLTYVSKLMHRRYPDTPPVQEGAAEHLAPGEQRPGDLRRRRRSSPTTPSRAAPAGAPSSPSSATSRSSSSIRSKTAGSAGRARPSKPRKDPAIQHQHFTGTGTRFLKDNGRAAIAGLFDRTFGR